MPKRFVKTHMSVNLYLDSFFAKYICCTLLNLTHLKINFFRPFKVEKGPLWPYIMLANVRKQVFQTINHVRFLEKKNCHSTIFLIGLS